MRTDRLYDPDQKLASEKLTENGQKATGHGACLSIKNGLLPSYFLGDPPHKIFLWDHQGIYLDYAYPNPLCGHFLNTADLIGRKVTEVLPHPASETVLSQIQRTATQQINGLSFIELRLNEKLHTIQIRFVPLQQYVLGLVNDFPFLNGNISQSSSPTITMLKKAGVLKHSTFTERERQVFLWVREGKTNWEIGEILGIAERTVRFHIENIFKKLDVSSRIQVAAYPYRTGRRSRLSKI